MNSSRDLDGYCLSAACDDDVDTAAEEKYPSEAASSASKECNDDYSAEEKYLLAAYQEYINDAEEWPNFEKMSKTHKYHGRGGESLPLLIRECGRLVPVYEENSDYVQFHPFNMPKVRVRRVHIIGMILSIKTSAKYIRFQVYDGTGSLDVFYKLEWFENQRKNRAEIDRLYKVGAANVARAERLMRLEIQKSGRCNAAAQQRIKQFQRDHASWWEKTREGMLGKPLLVGSYVHVFGFCNIDLNNAPPRSTVVRDNNFWSGDVKPRLLFNAFDVRSMTEKSYNETLLKWLDGVFEEKYVDVKKTGPTAPSHARDEKK